MSRQTPKHYDDAFKKQIVELYSKGKTVHAICQEYGLKKLYGSWMDKTL